MKLRIIYHFLKMESAGGILLFGAALFALILDNSPSAFYYEQIFNAKLKIPLGVATLQPLSFWINEGLMTLFFFLIGLELKREFLQGNLNQASKVVLPSIAALGGMLCPALIYIGVNFSHPETLKGWPIPVATDIAFALGILAMFGRRIPLELKLFLLTLAIFDDLGAIVIIGFYNGGEFSSLALFLAALTVVFLSLLNYFKKRNVVLYLLAGLILWVFVFKSGIHPTTAGVILAFSIPISLIRNLEQRLHPWVAFVILPLFAFANAGISFKGLEPAIIFDYVTLGIFLGLVLGKQLGVMLSVYAVIRLKWANLPNHSTWWEMYGVAWLCGIGFTMSLFLGNLAFNSSRYLIEVRLGVLLGSLLSGTIGALVLYCALKKKRRQM